MYSNLDLLGDLLYRAGQVLNGSRLSDEELIRVTLETFPNRPVCILRHWMILDVMVPESTHRELEAQGLRPTMVYAQTTVFDSQDNHRPGVSVISGYQRDFDGCIFESPNVVYILGGRGSRKHTSWPAIRALRETLAASQS